MRPSSFLWLAGLLVISSYEVGRLLAPLLQIRPEGLLSKPQATHSDLWSVWLPCWGPGGPSKSWWVSAIQLDRESQTWRPWLLCQTGGLLPLAVVLSRRRLTSWALPLEMARAVTPPAQRSSPKCDRPSQVLELADLLGQLGYSLHESRQGLRLHRGGRDWWCLRFILHLMDSSGWPYLY